jgi:hypothetical protein
MVMLISPVANGNGISIGHATVGAARLFMPPIGPLLFNCFITTVDRRCPFRPNDRVTGGKNVTNDKFAETLRTETIAPK